MYFFSKNACNSSVIDQKQKTKKNLLSHIQVVHIKHWSLAVRELIMAMVIGVLLLLLILFAGLYGKAQTDIGGAPSAAAIVCE